MGACAVHARCIRAARLQTCHGSQRECRWFDHLSMCVLFSARRCPLAELSNVLLPGGHRTQGFPSPHCAPSSCHICRCAYISTCALNLCCFECLAGRAARTHACTCESPAGKAAPSREAASDKAATCTTSESRRTEWLALPVFAC